MEIYRQHLLVLQIYHQHLLVLQIYRQNLLVLQIYREHLSIFQIAYTDSTLWYSTFTLLITINIINVRVYTRILNAIQNIKVENLTKCINKVES